jgi:RNA-splicing ligase RtcB
LNHFIEYGEDPEGKGYITVHTGSRNLGTRICDYWVSSGSKSIVKEAIKEANKKIKAEEPDRRKWRALIEQSTKEIKEKNPDGYLSGDSAKGYYSDMVIAQAYASFNHLEILRRLSKILRGFGINEIDRIKSTHNYIDFEDLIIRKGAIRAGENEIVLIPFNMRDGLGIFRGLGNPDWNNSAPHGAGRRMSRAKAFENLNMSEFSKTMEGIYSTSVVPSVLDESPMAYKDSGEILDLIDGKTVELLKIVKPKINLKDNGIRDRY